jgi:site-specific recombinase XerD
MPRPKIPEKWAWDEPGDPNKTKIMGYLNTISNVDSRRTERYRLHLILSYLYTEFGVKGLTEYKWAELNAWLIEINQSTDPRRKKENYRKCMVNFLQTYPHTRELESNLEKINDEMFRDHDYVWDADGDPNAEQIDEFLKTLRREETRNEARKKLENDLEFLYNKFGKKPLLEYSVKELRALMESIEKKKIQAQSKKRFRIALKNLIKYIINPLKAEGLCTKLDYNFVFSDDFCPKFSQKGHKRRKIIPSPGEYLSFLREVKKSNLEHYIMFKMLVSACRRGGLVSVKVCDINFDLNCFVCHEKPTKWASGENNYFFPSHFKKELRWYIEFKHLKSEDRLFPIHVQTPGLIFRRVYHKSWSPHMIRNMMLTAWQRAGMQKVDRDYLSNHEPESDEIVDATYVQNSDPVYLDQLYQKFDKLIFRWN